VKEDGGGLKSEIRPTKKAAQTEREKGGRPEEEKQGTRLRLRESKKRK
jgi:hypothetical protein